MEVEKRDLPKASHGNAGVWKAWKAKKPAFHPSHTPWKSLRGFPHSHGFDDDYHVFEDRQSPPQTRNQSHFRRKGLVDHVSGLKRKGCPGTLTPLRSSCCCFCPSEDQGRRCGQERDCYEIVPILHRSLARSRPAGSNPVARTMTCISCLLSTKFGKTVIRHRVRRAQVHRGNPEL